MISENFVCSTFFMVTSKIENSAMNSESYFKIYIFSTTWYNVAVKLCLNFYF